MSIPATPAPVRKATPAERLLGLELTNGWKVIKHLSRSRLVTGGNFSSGYVVEREGKRGFLKALDYTRAIRSHDAAKALASLTNAYIFERDLCIKCRNRSLDRVVHALDDGSIEVDAGEPFSKVQYIIFELADGDIWTRLSGDFDDAFALRTLHQLATGLKQLHGAGVAHQDVKPSNLLMFGAQSVKLADLGCAASKGEIAPRDGLPVAGDPVYAPPEFLYGYFNSTNWEARRTGCDVYHLGSMLVFLYTTVGMTTLLAKHIDPAYSHTNFKGSFDVLEPFIIDAFGRAIDEFEASISAVDFRPELISIVKQLCHPNPSKRGDLMNIQIGQNQFEMERFISHFNALARRAELHLVKTLSTPAIKKE